MESMAMDVTSIDSVENTFEQIYAKYGRLDALVNSAGIQKLTLLATMNWNDWSAVLEVNLMGTARCLQVAGRRMVQQGSGAIVNISSISADRGGVGRAPYAVSKAGVAALTRAAAVEWAGAGVRVNAVAPGYANTELIQAYVDSGKLELDPILRHIPMGRLADPMEIAGVVRFLCSADASYITGQIIAADGGFLADLGVPIADTSGSLTPPQ
jgi:3-oxoacyl-[acyl-carrier protein] reductase